MASFNLLVPHSSILPQSALPTNNYWAIANALHNIPGLAEWHFVIDDDTMQVALSIFSWVSVNSS